MANSRRESWITRLERKLEVLDKKAAAYLNGLPELAMSMDQMAEAIYDQAQRLLKKNNGEFEGLPSWVQSAADGAVPYYSRSNRGSSIYAKLSRSLPSQEAHLRRLYEHVKGRAPNAQLSFPVVVPWSELNV